MSLIDRLRALHLVDAQVRGIRTRLDGAERDYARQQSQFEALSAQRREQESQLRQLHATVANLELEDKAHLQRIEHLRAELNATSNTKQYNSIRDGLKAEEEKRDALAERILAQMENVERVKALLAAGEEPLANRTKLRDLAATALAEAKAAVGDRLQELEAERSRAAAALTAQALAAFEEAAEQNHGEALAEVTIVDLHHKEFACGGCHAELPRDAFSRVAARRDDVVVCISCGRILYMDTLPEPPAKKGARKSREQADGPVS
jgi:predicted  nucleic acid-binding Zn-ribbon protein